MSEPTVLMPSGSWGTGGSSCSRITRSCVRRLMFSSERLCASGESDPMGEKINAKNDIGAAGMSDVGERSHEETLQKRFVCDVRPVPPRGQVTSVLGRVVVGASLVQTHGKLSEGTKDSVGVGCSASCGIGGSRFRR